MAVVSTLTGMLVHVVGLSVRKLFFVCSNDEQWHSHPLLPLFVPLAVSNQVAILTEISPVLGMICHMLM